jgi:S1-C subfamily serine protease
MPPPSRLAVLRQRVGRSSARFRDVFLVGAGLLVALVALLLFNAANPPPRPLTQRDINAAVARAMASATPAPSYESQAYEIIRPSLVQVIARGSTTDPKVPASLGTGVVIDQGGTILTSLHIVKNAAAVHVVFADGTESDARITGTQPENDLAVLRPSITPDDIVPATFGGGLQVGDEVVAVGNPFGVSNSLTAGVVSGLGRAYTSPTTGEKLTNLIQFDAAVNPGNSGGPLLDRNGEVVGIVTGLMNPTGQDVFIGIGLAVPIETAAAGLGTSPY